MARKHRPFAPGVKQQRGAPQAASRRAGPGTERSDPEDGEALHGEGTKPKHQSDYGEVSARVERLLEAPIANLGCRLLDVIYRHEGRWVLRLVIDKPSAPDGAVTLDDCGNVSEVAGRILDVEDPIPNAFALEVTSPGLFRLLKERKHFAQSVGRIVRFTLAPGVLPDRKERTLRGTISALTDDTLQVTVGEEQLTVPWDAARSARLDPDL